MNIWRRQWMRRREEFLGCFAALAVGYVMGYLLSGNTERGAEVFRVGILLGSIFGYGAALLIHVIYGVFTMPGEFNLVVSMGETRKQFVREQLMFGLAELVGIQIAVDILQKIQMAIYGVLFDGMPMTGRHAAGGFLSGYLFLLELGILVVELLVGALLLRFGPKVLWGVMAVVFVLPSVWRGLSDRGLLPEHTRLAQALTAGDMSSVYTIPELAGFVAVLFLMLVTAWIMLRKQQVT